MPRKLIPWVLALCLAAAGVALYFCLQPSAIDAEADATRMAELGLMLLDGDEGVSVLAVRDGSPADRAGIRPGDVVLQADGDDVGSIAQLEEALSHAQRQMCLELRRSQEESVTLCLNLH